MSSLGTPLKPCGDEIGRTEIDLAREPGFGWTLSPEALADIEEMERANAVAVARLLASDIIVGGANGLVSEGSPSTKDDVL